MFVIRRGDPPRSKARRRTTVAVSAVLGAGMALGVPTAAFASTTSTTTVTVTPGSLSIGTLTGSTIDVPLAGSGAGLLPSGVWSDTTGSGAGWNGTVAVSDLTYTGGWAQTGGTSQALGSTTSSAYTGTGDGVEVTVTTGSGSTATKTHFSWSLNNGGSATSATATNGTPAALTTGVTIDFAAGTTYAATDVYTLKAGTEPSSAIQLDSTATGAGVTAQSGTTSTAPTLVATTTTVTGGGVGATAFGSAVKFVTAAKGAGMGSYTVKPGVKVTTDPSTWAATYRAGVQYTISTGP